MAVPTRPAAGAPIDSTWGGIAHDTAVAQDIQVGAWTTPANVSQVTITFPRAFASAPMVFLSLQSGSRNYMVNGGAVTPSTCTVTTAQMASGSLPVVPTGALSGHWLAIGPRA